MQQDLPIILSAGFCWGRGFLRAALGPLPALADDAPELAPAAFSAAGVLDLSDMVVMDRWCSACAHEDGRASRKFGDRGTVPSSADFTFEIGDRDTFAS